MRGTFFLGAEKEVKFEVRDMDFPEVLGPHQVLIKNMACGVCGTDVHIYHGFWVYEKPPPRFTVGTAVFVCAWVFRYCSAF